MNEEDKKQVSNPGSTEIASRSRRRRTFLGSVLVGSIGAAAAGFQHACKQADRCDSDTTSFRDSDPRDLTTRPGDRCDRDRG